LDKPVIYFFITDNNRWLFTDSEFSSCLSGDGATKNLLSEFGYTLSLFPFRSMLDFNSGFLSKCTLEQYNFYVNGDLALRSSLPMANICCYFFTRIDEGYYLAYLRVRCEYKFSKIIGVLLEYPSQKFCGSWTSDSSIEVFKHSGLAGFLTRGLLSLYS